jgi:hypothetical protein
VGGRDKNEYYPPLLSSVILPLPRLVCRAEVVVDSNSCNAVHMRKEKDIRPPRLPGSISCGQPCVDDKDEFHGRQKKDRSVRQQQHRGQ